MPLKCQLAYTQSHLGVGLARASDLSCVSTVLFTVCQTFSHITWFLYTLSRYGTHLAAEEAGTWCLTVGLLISDIMLTPLL